MNGAMEDPPGAYPDGKPGTQVWSLRADFRSNDWI